jgi:glycosyltransferase involved in cell wall biosynthesis
MSVSMLSENLANAGVETEVYTTTANGEDELDVTAGQPVSIDGVKVTYFHRVTKDHSHYSPQLFKKLKQEAGNFDLVHIHAWWNLVSLFSCAIALNRNIPVLLSPRGTLSPYSFQNHNIGVKWLIHQLIGKRLLEKCFIHVTSEREQQAVAALFKPKSITVIANFVKLPVQKLYPVGKLSGPFRLIFFSRIEAKKGLDLLIMALPLVQNDYVITVAGDGEESYIAELKSLAAACGVDKNMVWAGFVGEDKFDILQGNDLFVLPSYDENFGNAVIESLSVGTPVLISEEVGLADYVGKNQLGWTCKTDAAAIGAAINDIVSTRQAELDEIKERAPGVIYRDFSPVNLVAKYTDMYTTIINV